MKQPFFLYSSPCCGFCSIVFSQLQILVGMRCCQFMSIFFMTLHSEHWATRGHPCHPWRRLLDLLRLRMKSPKSSSHLRRTRKRWQHELGNMGSHSTGAWLIANATMPRYCTKQSSVMAWCDMMRNVQVPIALLEPEDVQDGVNEVWMRQLMITYCVQPVFGQ